MTNNKNIQKDNEKLESYKRILKFYILPIFSMGLFMIVVILLIIPKFSEIFNSLDQISQNNEAYNKSKTSLDELQSASKSSNKLLAELKVVNETTPSGKTEVVKFRDKITELTVKNNLQILSQRLSETNLEDAMDDTPATNTTNKNDKLSLQEVPFSFEIQGSYDSLIGFINDLSVIDDFVIVRQMELNANSNSSDNSWILKLTIDKYQFNEISEEAKDTLFLNIPIDAEPSQNVLNYVNGRIE